MRDCYMYGNRNNDSFFKPQIKVDIFHYYSHTDKYRGNFQITFRKFFKTWDDLRDEFFKLSPDMQDAYERNLEEELREMNEEEHEEQEKYEEQFDHCVLVDTIPNYYNTYNREKAYIYRTDDDLFLCLYQIDVFSLEAKQEFIDKFKNIGWESYITDFPFIPTMQKLIKELEDEYISKGIYSWQTPSAYILLCKPEVFEAYKIIFQKWDVLGVDGPEYPMADIVKIANRLFESYKYHNDNIWKRFMHNPRRKMCAFYYYLHTEINISNRKEIKNFGWCYRTHDTIKYAIESEPEYWQFPILAKIAKLKENENEKSAIEL